MAKGVRGEGDLARVPLEKHTKKPPVTQASKPLVAYRHTLLLTIL